MEALLILLGEFLLLPLIAGLVALLQVVICFFGLVAELGFALLGRAMRRRGLAEARPPPRSSPWRRRLRIAFTGTFALLLVALLVVNYVLFDPIVRWTLRRVEGRTGIAVTYEAVDGNLLTGRIGFQGARLRRTKSDTSTFDLSAAYLDLDVSVLGVWSRPLPIQSLRIGGLTGTFERHGKPDRATPRRGYEIAELVVDDAWVRVTDHTARGGTAELEVGLDSWRARPLRSRLAVFDVLFRSNGTGTLDDQPFEITTDVVGEGRTTRWKAKAVPVSVAAAYIAGPLVWLEEGTVDVDVEDRWELGTSTRIHMDWSLTLSNHRAAAPPDLGLAWRVAAKPIVAYLNSRQELPLRFSMTIDEDRFEGAASPETLQLWSTVTTTMTDKLASLSGVAPDKIRELGRKGLDGFRRFLDKRRKKGR